MAKKRYHLLTIIGSAGLAWNLIGLLILIGSAYNMQSARYTMSAAQRALDDLTPNWVIIGSVVAVLAGLVGSLGLLMRRSWSIQLLNLSLVALAAQDVGMAIAVWRAGTMPDSVTLALQTLVLVCALGLLLIALSARAARELH